VVDTYLACHTDGRSGDDGFPLFRRREEDMPGLGIAPHPDVPLGSYVHTKSGDRYEVIGGVNDSSSKHDAVCVLYQSVKLGFICSRPVDDFLHGVPPGPGKPGLVPRFQKYGQPRPEEAKRSEDVAAHGGRP
jgi:hypothetical protein